MTTLSPSSLTEHYSLFPEKSVDNFPQYKLKWRQGQLLVRLSIKAEQPHLPSLYSKQWLTDCLQHSQVKLVRVDPSIEKSKLKLWADACAKAGKPLFLWVSHLPNLPQKKAKVSWWLKLLVDRIAAALLLVFLTPVMLSISLLILAQSPGTVVFSQWCVGERGKVFRIFKFRTLVVNAEKQNYQVVGNQENLYTPLGFWLHKYSLDKLPQLFNVLRGEMSLVGSYPLALSEVVKMPPEQWKLLNALPGITGVWQVTENCCVLEYVRNWSLGQDLKILLLSVPKVVSGFGAY